MKDGKMLGERLQGLDLQVSEAGHMKYKRLKSHVISELHAGRLKPGQPLPSEQQLATSLQIARTTVRRAMAELESDGLIRRVKRKGTFVDEQVFDRLGQGQGIFAIVVPQIREGFYPSLLQSFETAAHGVHHQAIVCGSARDVQKQSDIILQLMDKKVDGVAIVPASYPPSPAYQFRQLQEQGIPLVFCHRRVDGVRAPLLAIPYHQVGRLAGEAFLKRGHRRVAFFGAAQNLVTAAYEAGLRQAMEGGGGRLPEEFVYLGNPHFQHDSEQQEQIRDAVEQMFRNSAPPTAIFTSFDSCAEVLYLILGQMGKRLPEDVSLLGFGGTRREGAILHQLTSVVIDEVEIGRRAVGLLQEMRNGQRTLEDTQETTMSLGMSEGSTLGPAAHTAETKCITQDARQ